MNHCCFFGSKLFSLLLIIVLGLLGSAYGFNHLKWIPLKSGDKLPEGIIKIDGDRYVGRARHFDEILPAEITKNGTAKISSCHKEIKKENFEILTATIPSECEWKKYNYFQDLDESAVRVGTASNNEPIYIAKINKYYDDYGNYRYDINSNHISSIYLASTTHISWAGNEVDNNNYRNYLRCETNLKWIDAAATNLPNNTISGGKSEDDYDIYVARLKRNCEIVVGQACPQLGLATAVLNDNRDIESVYSQVLVGEPSEYSWVAASDGEIPDFAVAGGKIGNQMCFIAKLNKTIGHLSYSEAFQGQLDYEILVMNRSP